MFRRWFILSNFTLSYFDKRDSKEAKGSMDLSCIGVCCAVLPGLVDGRCASLV
jgi:hypothetical protein